MDKSHHNKKDVASKTTTTAYDAGAAFLQRHFDILLYACIGLAALWALAPMLDNDFYNDDFLWIRAARHDMTWSNVLTTRVIGFFGR